MVPQSPADLSDEDRQKLMKLDLPSDKWDNLHALQAMYYRSKTYDVFSIQVSKPGMELNCKYVLEQIGFLLMNSVNKEGGESNVYCIYTVRSNTNIPNSYYPLLRQW